MLNCYLSFADMQFPHDFHSRQASEVGLTGKKKNTTKASNQKGPSADMKMANPNSSGNSNKSSWLFSPKKSAANNSNIANLSALNYASVVKRRSTGTLTLPTSMAPSIPLSASANAAELCNSVSNLTLSLSSLNQTRHITVETKSNSHPTLNRKYSTTSTPSQESPQLSANIRPRPFSYAAAVAPQVLLPEKIQHQNKIVQTLQSVGNNVSGVRPVSINFLFPQHNHEKNKKNQRLSRQLSKSSSPPYKFQKLASSEIFLETPPSSISTSVSPADTDEIVKILCRFLSNEFDCHGNSFLVTDYSRNELFAISLGIFIDFNLICTKSNLQQLFHLIVKISDNYLSNPYHSFEHAVDVMFMVYFILKDLKISTKFGMKQEEIAAILISALTHDVLHPGLNNLFQVNACTEYAIKYNNESVLENLSIDFIMDILQTHSFLEYLAIEPESRILESEQNQQQRFKTQNQSTLTNVSEDIEKKNMYINELNTMARTIENEPTKENFSKEQRIRLLCLILHAADISNAARPLLICKCWSLKVIREFRYQNTIEMSMNLDTSFQTDNPAQISLEFNEIISAPYFSALEKVLGCPNVFMENVNSNAEYWRNECSIGNDIKIPSGRRRVSVAAGTIEITP
ncbi:High affinity cAMP-specific and IBMX-insensitive 3',5'-cyclic phosphodiesterase 9A, partial [Nowakowskiella sp. JEL0078]